jgi:type IV fimbrial biogenesis protein FimT
VAGFTPRRDSQGRNGFVNFSHRERPSRRETREETMPIHAQRAGRVRGFTLIETSAALAVAATLATIALPSFGPMVERRKVESAAAQLAGDLQFLRSEAVARNRPLRIRFEPQPDGGSCYALQVERRADCACADAARGRCEGEAATIKAVLLPTSGRVRIEANVQAIVYDPAYGTSTPAATLRVHGSGGTTLHQVVNMMGRVRTCAPNGDFAGYRACGT